MAGTLLADTVVLGDNATQSQNLVLKTNNDGTFTIERQSGEDLITIDGSGNVTLPTGLKLGAGTDVLSVYDEGTWTPSLKFGGNSVGMTYAAQSGTYTRIGRMVSCTATVTLSAKGSSTGACTITGLPFSSLAFGGVTFSQINNMLFTGVPCGYTNGTSISLQQATDAGALSNITEAGFTNTTQILIVATYFV